MPLEDLCAAIMRPGYTLVCPAQALLWLLATPLRAAPPQRGLPESHAVRDLAFPPLGVHGPRKATSSGGETQRGRCQSTPRRATRKGGPEDASAPLWVRRHDEYQGGESASSDRRSLTSCSDGERPHGFGLDAGVERFPA